MLVQATQPLVIEAINFARVGAQKLWAGTVVIHPKATTGATPRAPSSTPSTIEAAPIQAGQMSRCRSSSPLALRQGSTGATAIRNSSVRLSGMVMRLKYGVPTEMRIAVVEPKPASGRTMIPSRSNRLKSSLASATVST